MCWFSVFVGVSNVAFEFNFAFTGNTDFGAAATPYKYISAGRDAIEENTHVPIRINFSRVKHAGPKIFFSEAQNPYFYGVLYVELRMINP